MKQPRVLTRIIDAVPSSDGDGVKIKRIAGRDVVAQLDPFLLLDEIRSDEAADYIGGFPAHPHRGFETVTYMIKGAMQHRDHLGNVGQLNDGDVQWMTAGRGVIHSEMPMMREGLLHGFQLWLNLPATEKMLTASYQDYRADELPQLTLENGGELKVIVGSIDSAGSRVQSPVYGGSTDPIYLDIQLPAGEHFELPLDTDYQAALYVYEGRSTELSVGQLGLYSRGDSVRIEAGEEGVEALLIAGRPIKEPIRQYGPFVMNTADEIEEAIRDYKEGRLVAT